MDITSLLVSLITGAVGGNAAGALLKKFSLGTLGNTIAGLVGGGLGGQILGSLIGGGGGGIGMNIAESGVGGAVLMVIVGLIKNAMANK